MPCSLPRRRRAALHWLLLVVLSGLTGCGVAPQRLLHPFRPPAGYWEEGVASWYGPPFHGRQTANGEVYNMDGLTAAHRTLPLGVWADVTHLGNGRSVRLWVNDRGPFVRGRLIDLSRGAARQLGILDDGLAPVRVVVSTTQMRRALEQLPEQPVYTLQVGSFRSERNARLLLEKLRSRYDDVFVQKHDERDLTFYRVRVGKFATDTSARSVERRLERDGYEPLLTAQ